MNLDHTPHPLTEDHYHIRELIENQDKRSKDRGYHQQRIKATEERTNDIADYKLVNIMEFWCQVCKIDFVSKTIKQVEKDWKDEKELIAFYKTKCWKGHWCIRLITDRYRDGYYRRSKRVARDREKHTRDTIQPYEIGFNMLYGKTNNL